MTIVNNARLIADKAKQLLGQQDTVLIGIDGKSGVGKTTLAAELARVCDCNVFHTDDFFLPQVKKTTQRLSEPGGNVDYEAIHSELILPLLAGIDFSYKPYSCKTASKKDPVQVNKKSINILEGVYSLHPYFGGVFDLKFVLECDMETRLDRIKNRSGEPIFQRFLCEWIPLEDVYFEMLYKNGGFTRLEG